MASPDRLLYSALHGTAMRYAVERRNLDESIEELRDIADGRNDILGPSRRNQLRGRGTPGLPHTSAMG
jgi:hypothetical protein